MSIRYELSDRQRKEILVRGSQLRIALPVPPYDLEDPLVWARDVLPADIRQLAISAEEAEIAVKAMRTTTAVPTLTSHLGEIVEDDTHMYCQTVVVVVVTLRPQHCRRDFPRVQWPLRVHYHGRDYP